MGFVPPLRQCRPLLQTLDSPIRPGLDSVLSEIKFSTRLFPISQNKPPSHAPYPSHPRLHVDRIPGNAQFCGRRTKVLFEEKFTDRLDPGWKWIREQPDAWRLANGALIVNTLPGSYWEKQNSSQNTLVRPAPVSLKAGFIVEVLLESEPKGQYQHAGLLCYFDGENTLILNKESIGGKGHVLMVTEQDGKPDGNGPHRDYAEHPSGCG